MIVGELLERLFVNPFLAVVLADGMVLTVHTAEIAVAEKDVPDAATSTQCGLLTEMKGPGGNDREIPRIAP